MRSAVRMSGAIAALLLLSACDAPGGHDHDHGDGHDHAAHEGALLAADSPLGVMTALPLLWPLDATVADIAGGTAPMPWIGARMEERFNLVALDTLAPIAPANEGESARDPLADLMQLAVIQPRALTPEDNVALDAWVRKGGHLLLALDPALTGHYELAMGDPRMPPMGALLPPVLMRWGLAMRFDDDAQVREVAVPGGKVPLDRAGSLTLREGTGSACEISGGGALAVCTVGKGRVTVLADAAVFEHEDHADETGHDHDHDHDGEHDHESDRAALFALLDHAFPKARD